jgi:hypothetical protein
MKKKILTLGLLLATAGLASAQSYPKQPDPKVVNYVPYQKPEPLKEEPEAEAEIKDAATGDNKIADKEIQRREEEQPASKEKNPEMSRRATQGTKY